MWSWIIFGIGCFVAGAATAAAALVTIAGRQADRDILSGRCEACGRPLDPALVKLVREKS